MNVKHFAYLLLAVPLVWTGCIFDDAAPKKTPSNNVTTSDMSADMVADIPADTPEDITMRDMSDDASMDQSQDMMDPSDMNAQCDCPTPPSASCQDGQTRKIYSSPGCDTNDQCLQNGFIESTEPCDAAPAATCKDNKTALTYDPSGRCMNGQCVYEETETPCEKPANTCVDAKTLKVYTGDARCENGACTINERTEDCGDVGCCADRCCELTPSNTADFGTLRTTNITSGPPSGRFNTSNDCTSNSVLGQCAKITMADGLGACVCHTDSITINNLEVTGDRALVILAKERIEVRGTLNVSAKGSVNGPGASYQYNPADVNASAAGGTMGSVGGRSPIQTPVATATLIPLKGGCQGQSVCTASKGGGAGGALQLTAGKTIVITGTILANGGGGARGDSGGSTCLDGAGGGSGGGVLIEAPDVQMTGSILAQGGGGGSGGSTDHLGRSGQDGKTTKAVAPGGSRIEDQTCALYGSIYSGTGGYGAIGGTEATRGGSGDYETRCIGGNTYSGSGGGGGGVGRIRINTKRGAQSCLCGGTFSPSPTFGQVAYQ